MSRDEIRNAIEFYFEVIERLDENETREASLRFALDRLSLAYHFADYTADDSDYAESQKRDYQAIREVVSNNFPQLGYYNVAGEISEKIAEAEVHVGDAIDDICDIAGDLEEVLWCWDNTSIDNALWNFKFGYDSHWGKHLRDLQLYLYAKEHGW